MGRGARPDAYVGVISTEGVVAGARRGDGVDETVQVRALLHRGPHRRRIRDQTGWAGAKDYGHGVGSPYVITDSGPWLSVNTART